MNGPATQCLAPGLEGALSQNWAWSWDRVLERERQAPQTLRGPWTHVYLMLSCPSAAGLRNRKGRVHTSDLDPGSGGVWYENTCPGREP